MKISKEKLKRIIKEELDLFEQEQPSDDKDPGWDSPWGFGRPG